MAFSIVIDCFPQEFHRELQCLVAIELKIDDFKPEYLKKMRFILKR